ncbi:MAG: GTP cyclohydrolase II [Alphaproteobacteria bacterium]
MTDRSPPIPPHRPLPATPLLPGALQAVERAIADLRRGAIVVLHGRGRALLTLAAEGTSREALARLRALSRSDPALVLTGRRAHLLGFVDGGDGSVRFALPGGASAETVRRMADPAAGRTDDLPRPLAIDRIDPASDSGAIDSGAVELAKLAGLLPAVVVAPVPRERLGWLDSWCDRESLLSTELEAIGDYRDGEARALQIVGEARVPLAGVEAARVVAFRPPDGGREHLAIVIGAPDARAPVLTRVHSECFTGDLLGSLRCDCGDQLRGAIAEIASAGAGVLLYLAQEGRGIGLVNKLRAYALQDHGHDTIDANEQLGFEPDERLYKVAARMLELLDFRRVRLLTNNPAKVTALAAFGIDVAERVPHSFPSNPHNAQYLATKQARAGHIL